MRTPLALSVALACLAGSAAAQSAKPSLTAKVKSAVKAAADTGANRAAAAVIDTVLGTGGTRIGHGTCPMGTVPLSPTVGGALVGKVRQGLKPDSATPPAASCAVDTAMLRLQAAGAEQAQLDAQLRAQADAAAAASVAPSAGSVVGAMAAATPIGLAATAAPSAAKALGGLLGKGQTAAGMIKDLSKGRLELKGIRFIGASDALEGEVADDFAMLAEALQAIEGDFVLNLPAELDAQGEPDTVMVRRRQEKLAAHLAVAGLGERLEQVSGPPGLDPKKKAPKLGQARAEVLRKPPAGER